MDAVIRAAVVYAFVLLIFRAAGRRTLAELTGFDFVLLLIIGESTQQALLGDDFSVTNALLVIMTLIGIDIGLSFVKARLPMLAKIIDGVPMVVAEKGRFLSDRMRKARIDEDDVLDAARSQRGLERLDQIKYAILEANGGITVIPYSEPVRTRSSPGSRKKSPGSARRRAPNSSKVTSK